MQRSEDDRPNVNLHARTRGELSAGGLRIAPGNPKFCASETNLSKFLLKLYITGSTPRSEQAIANLRHVCETELRDKYRLEIIDVLEDPEAAERDRILATPTLIKLLPPPLRRVIGDLSDKEKVLVGLELRRGDVP